ncbi:hypothetical protein [Pleionea sp. CnH1-48]|uniref:hypothetical protein n=1 Tax=Pleionea sp. CnH1-48 TaxID=2954494 RepID=UPI0020982293|nr:hypothetical protein [Pleionea sp. CnH1-48]MCO7223074.1 hypothetical protein [Pleionea sp. CnH1-48]
MESLRLTFPTQQQGQHLLVETDHGELKNWLASLPFGDMGRAVQEIKRAIASLNRSSIGLGLRQELVELFDQTYKQIHDSYRPNASHIVNDEARRKEHDNLHQLTREMAFAHKILVNGELKRRRLWGKNKALIRSINLALHYLGILLIEHYESYTPIPVYLWRECNSLYYYSQEKRIEDFTIFDDVMKYHCLPTIEQTYARICLMSVSNPYHLSQGEHWQMFRYLRDWVKMAEFSDDGDDHQPNRCFIVQLNSQLKPDYSSEFEGDINDEFIRFMLTHDLVLQINYHLDSLNANQHPPMGFHKGTSVPSARSLLEHMLEHWSQKAERKGRRYPILTKLDAIWGLQPIYSLLVKHQQDIESTHWDGSQIEELLQGEHNVPLAWEASNVSDGGIGLTTHKNIAHLLKVGDLVIIREYIDKKPSYHWRVAICRWLFGDENSGTRAGLEFITGYLNPVRLFNQASKSVKSKGQAALILKHRQEDGDNAAPSLIASRGSYQDDRAFVMKYDNKEENIRPRNRIMVTPCIEQFYYQTYDIVEVKEPTEQEGEEEIMGAIPWTSQPKFDEELSKEPNPSNLSDVRLPGDH